MVKHYLKIAWRNLLRRKAFSVINIIGLSVGMAAFFLIYLYASFETSYDDFNTKSDRIYRVVSDLKTPSQNIKLGVVAEPLAIYMKNDFPEVEDAVRIASDGFLVKKGDVKFQEEKTLMADSTLFNIFDFPLIEGSKNTALKEPMSVVLSQTAAKKYFGNKDPLGQHILLTGAAINATITGVMKDIPENSQLQADMLVSMSSYFPIYGRPVSDSSWNITNFLTYVLLKPQADIKAFEKKLPAFIDKYNGEDERKLQTFETLSLEPLRDVYLNTSHTSFTPAKVFKTGNSDNVYIFLVIGAFIMLLACINFINLTTARSAERAKEVGIRKVMGAVRFQLTKQFIAESILICLMAFVLAVLLCQLSLPLFNLIAGKTISSSIFNNLTGLLLLLLLAVGIGIVAGIYPSLVLSSFKPVVVLKGHFSTNTKGVKLRKSLVVFQFVISTILIIGTIIVYTQLNYMHNKDLGFNKEQELIINTNYDKNRYAFKESLASITGVVSSTWSSSVPGAGYASAHSEVENAKGEIQKANLNHYFVDFNYIDQYNLKLITGRSFSKEFATDSTQSMVINESAVRLFGYTSAQDAIGKEIKQWGRQGKIIGVVKDFNYRSLKQKIEPLSMGIDSNGFTLLSIKVATTNLPATLKAINNKWNTAIPNRPFDYYFLDDAFSQQYATEMNFGKLFLNFSVLAILIACLGLLGLSSYSILQCKKEIGIRKVFGARVSDIVQLLLADFIKLVLLALLIAMPMAWFVMDRWLEKFAYRTNITWWMFGLAAFGSLLIAFSTISFQAIKAALENPIKSLKIE